jgi:hypothetical protein
LIRTARHRALAGQGRHATIAALTVASVALSISMTTGAHGATGTTAATGVASGAFTASPSNLTTFGTWRGATAGLAHGFVAGGTWADIEVSSSWAKYWGGSPYASKMLITLPMLPKDTSTTIQQGATGAYDAYFKLTAQHLVAAGMGNAIIRTGHEFNQNWPRWSARSAPATYASYFRHIVTAMRSVPGQSFRFTWCPSASYAGWDPTTAYPGDGYVDVISVDSYDSWWNHPTVTPQQRWANIVTANKQGGLDFWASFATAHSKPFGFSEWALVNKTATMSDGGGGGDDPYYIQQMHDWMATHNVAYESYFEKDAPDGSHMLEGTLFPNAASLYKTLWSATAATTVTSTSPTSAASTTSTTPLAAQRVAIRANRHHFRVGHRVVFTGIVRPRHHGVVKLQQRRNGRWHTVRTGSTNRFGRYSFASRPTVGTFVGRVVALKFQGGTTGHSRRVVLHVRARSNA